MLGVHFGDSQGGFQIQVSLGQPLHQVRGKFPRLEGKSPQGSHASGKIDQFRSVVNPLVDFDRYLKRTIGKSGQDIGTGFGRGDGGKHLTAAKMVGPHRGGGLRHFAVLENPADQDVGCFHRFSQVLLGPEVGQWGGEEKKENHSGAEYPFHHDVGPPIGGKPCSRKFLFTDPPRNRQVGRIRTPKSDVDKFRWFQMGFRPSSF